MFSFTLTTRTIRNTVIMAVFFSVSVLAGLIPAAAHENHAPLPTKGVTIAGNNILLSEKARKAIGLTIEKVTLGDLHRTVEVNARVELPWNQQAMITSLVPGKIEKVLAGPGEKVAAGQELAQLVSSQLESLQLALLQASNQVALAQRVAQQQRALNAQGVIAGKSLMEAESDLAQQQAQLRIAREKLLSLGIDDKDVDSVLATGKPLAYLSIRSPIAGVITHADVRIGQVVKTTDHLYHVANTARVWIVGEVLESDVRYLKKGQQVTANFAAYPDRRFKGTIDHVRLKMNRRRRTQAVVIALENKDGLLRPGMFGRVSIEVQVAKKAIVCPADAIIKSRSGRYVLVQKSPGKYESRPLKIGLAKGDQVEILEGAFPGDHVVVTGVFLLASLLGNEHKARPPGVAEAAPTAKDSSGELITVVDATVELPTNQQSFAGPRIEGRIRRVLVAPSQRVTAGQLLAEVDCLELRTVQLDLLLTGFQLRLVNDSLARLKGLSDNKLIPQRRIWELQNDQQRLLNHQESLNRKLAFFGLTEKEIALLAKVDLSRKEGKARLLSALPIRAPADGWIVDFNVVPGQVVHGEDQLFEIHDLSRVWVKGYVFERDASRVAVGQRAKVTFSALPAAEVTGKVVRIAPTMEQTERVLPIWIEVDNPGQRLKEGMLARVAILTAEKNDKNNNDARPGK